MTAYSYSTDSPPLTDGGLGLASSASCNGTTATTAHRWVTPVINSSAAVTATGNAALSMPTSLLSGNVAAGAPGRLCINVYSTTLNGSNQASGSSLLGSYTYQLADWPEKHGVHLVPVPRTWRPARLEPRAGKRLMVELTTDSAYSLGMALVYDHPNFPASIQLETQ